MQTVLIYSSTQTITDESFCRTVQKISGLFGDKEPVSLLSCIDNVDFLRIFKKYSKKYQVFITNELFCLIKPSLLGLLQGYSITDRLGDDENCDGLIAIRNNHLAVALPQSEQDIADIICKAFCYKIFKPGLSYSYYTLSVSQSDTYEVESKIRENIKTENQHISVVKNGELTDVYVFAASKNDLDAREQCKLCVNAVSYLFGESAFSDDINSLAGSVVKTLLKNGLKISTAESCTAGMISSEITSVPNSSGVFEIGISSYSNRIKNAALGVLKDTLEDYGAISAETAIEMAKGIRNLSGSDIGLSVTGVAGPNTSEGKSVGTVFISLVDKHHKWVIKFDFGENNSRAVIRKKATYEALELLRRYLACLPYTLQGSTDIASPYCLLSEQPTSKDFSVYKPESPENSFAAEKGSFDYTMNSAGVSDDDIFSNADNPSFFTKVKNFIGDIKYEFSSKFAAINKKIAVRVLAGVVALAILVTSASVFAYFADKSNNDKLIKQVRTAWDISVNHDETDNSQYFQKLQKISPDILSWISVANTEIENPVCKTSDNDYFTKHNLLGKLSTFGALHYDKNAKITPDGAENSKNLIIYGNNAKDGSMFGALKSYKTFSYLKDNSLIKLYNGSYFDGYHIFSVMIISDKAEENGDNFHYLVSDFADEESFNTWLTGVKERSLFQTVAEISSNSKFLTLITDSDDFDGAKLVITAFFDPTLNIDDNYYNTLKVNPAPRYPQIWYKIHGAKDPYGKYREDPIPESSEEQISFVTSEISSASPSDTSETSDVTLTSDDSSSSKATNSKATSSKDKKPTSSRTSSSRTSSQSRTESKPESQKETSSHTSSKPNPEPESKPAESEEPTESQNEPEPEPEEQPE